eukprot:NODE_8865_length_339_cov_167.851724_g7105_i0.p1 GENE.NODE_8865_length_339_cov_167.851724_g7105_i0~~NODE_8865_length_339_cov_167.851724_g7105_i0.p1  ORF type:complete len:69 (+),score=22.22 NODE_8865_length_339_cov_167.851724_g7105_i0:29-208(+)
MGCCPAPTAGGRKRAAVAGDAGRAESELAGEGRGGDGLTVAAPCCRTSRPPSTREPVAA